MTISPQIQATLLLTAWFTKPAKGDPKPLTPKEWGRFAKWLHEQGRSPEQLMDRTYLHSVLSAWSDSAITEDRLTYLLGRGGALGLALEKWHRAGLWVMTRSDQDYPRRLWKRLKADAPPLLFGCGNRLLLDRGGVAVIGSRDATDGDLKYTAWLGGMVAAQGYSVVSGAARGVDEAAMLGALHGEGTVIGVMADSLLRAATSAKFRKNLMNGNLVLVSPFNPEAGFDVGNAMARNKYIYCLSDAAVVIATAKGKGGTWNGAIENLKHRWVPLWIKAHPDPSGGNTALVKEGAAWLPEEPIEVGNLFNQAPQVPSEPAQVGFFDGATRDSSGHPSGAPSAGTSEPDPVASIEAPLLGPDHPLVSAKQNHQSFESMSLYEFFLHKLAIEAETAPLSVEELQTHLVLTKAQVNDWLKQAVAEGRVKKYSKPVRYGPMKEIQETLALNISCRSQSM